MPYNKEAVEKEIKKDSRIKGREAKLIHALLKGNRKSKQDYDMKHPSAFRNFIQEKWFEHKDEIYAWTGKALTEYDDKYYFRKHKWLLKTMFKKEQENND